MSELVEGARLEIVYSGNRVGGSNPPLSARQKLLQGLSGDVAQLGERLVRNEEVGGSIPLISTKNVSSPRSAGVLGHGAERGRSACVSSVTLFWPC